MSLEQKVFERNGKTVVMFKPSKADIKKMKSSEPEQAFRQLMTKHLSQYYSGSMFVYSLASDESFVEYDQFRDGNVLFRLTVEPLRSRNQGIYGAEYGGLRKEASLIKGSALTAEIRPVYNIRRDSEGVRSWYESVIFTEGRSIDKNPSYEEVLAALLQRTTLSDVINGRCSQPFHMNPGPNLYLYNPTQERVGEAVEEYQRFIEYVKGHKRMITEIGVLVTAAKEIYGLVSDRQGKKSIAILMQQRDEIIQKADELLKGISRIEFPGLQDKLLKETNIGSFDL